MFNTPTSSPSSAGRRLRLSPLVVGLAWLSFRMPRPKAVTTLAVVFLVLCLECFLAWGQNDVLTQHNDNTRSGLNPNETLLTAANVNVNGFGKLFTQNVDGMIVGQPLYANQVLMNDGLVHNVVYVATQNNTVYAERTPRAGW